jgi:photosystem II stability/assembly factor-like uncharacterized protein
MNLYLGLHDGLMVVDPDHSRDASVILPGTRVAAIDVDPLEPARVYCATTNAGLLRSTDAGNTWVSIGEETMRPRHVLAVAVSPANPSTVFAGTEPSALYRSDNGGDTWRELSSLQDIPSKRSWSFPPKPETHHVRWITPHPADGEHLFVAIEAGAIVQSHDSGQTWQDRVPGGPIDSHTVRIHPDRPDRLLSAAGDGFFMSLDRGQTWQNQGAGLPWRYCYGLALDSSNPDVAVMSVSPGPFRGHGSQDRAQAVIAFRHSDSDWETATEGLPDAEGTTLSILAADPTRAGNFFALNNTGLYHSADGGRTWRQLDVPWKDEYLDHRPPTLAIGTA